MSVLWADEGPISQGKIITAILQDCPETASEMLHGWARKDLHRLKTAALKLELLIMMELARRPR